MDIPVSDMRTSASSHAGHNNRDNEHYKAPEGPGYDIHTLSRIALFANKDKVDCVSMTIINLKKETATFWIPRGEVAEAIKAILHPGAGVFSITVLDQQVGKI